MTRAGNLNRRTFLKSSEGAAGAVIALPQIVPSTVFGADAPSNRIVMAVIGTGGMGSMAPVGAIATVSNTHRT